MLGPPTPTSFFEHPPPTHEPGGVPTPLGCTFRSRGSCGIHDGEAGPGRLRARGGGYLSLSMRHPLLPPLQKMGDHPPPPAFLLRQAPTPPCPEPFWLCFAWSYRRKRELPAMIERGGCPPVMWPEWHPPHPHSSGREGDPLPPTFWK